MKILDGKIMPGEGIDKFKLGVHVKNIIQWLNDEYVIQERDDGSCVITIENAMFWFDEQRLLFQIGVTKGYSGKIDGRIGIGDTLSDVKKELGTFYEEGDDYLITNVKGVALELSDDDDWNELMTPIEWIYAYRLWIMENQRCLSLAQYC